MKKEIKAVMVIILMMTGCTKTNKYFDNGTCGDNARWQVEQDGTLRITGTGIITREFLTYTEEYERLHDVIKKIVIEEGITGIAEEASFANVDQVEEVILPDTLEGEIGSEFGYNQYLKHVRIGKAMKQTNAEYMYDCARLESVENASAYEIPLSTAKGKRKWYVDGKEVKTCPPNATAYVTGQTYQLSFDFNGGSSVEMPTIHQYGRVTTLNVPDKEGMFFMGWYEIKKSGSVIRFFDQIPAFSARDFHLKAMYANYKLETIDGGFKVVMSNTDDFKPYNEVIAFRYADNESMKNPIWGDLVSPTHRGEVTGLEKGKTYYVELFAVDYEWYLDANPEEDVEDDSLYHAKSSIEIK